MRLSVSLCLVDVHDLTELLSLIMCVYLAFMCVYLTVHDIIPQSRASCGVYKLVFVMMFTGLRSLFSLFVADVKMLIIMLLFFSVHLISVVNITMTSNLTKWPHHHCTWTVQSYSPGGANVSNTASLDLLRSTFQTASRLVQLFLRSSQQKVPMLYIGLHLTPLKTVHSHGGSGPPPSNT